jgi:hypothetical protein
MIEIENAGQTIGESELMLLEREFGHQLPEDYKQFLRKQNGGTPWPDVVDVEGLSSSPTDVQVFFGMGREVESSDLLWNLRLIEARVPVPRMLPIACDSGGNLFCLRPLSGVQFDVLYCDLSGPTDRLYDVAPDFGSFLDRIREWKD